MVRKVSINMRSSEILCNNSTPIGFIVFWHFRVNAIWRKETNNRNRKEFPKTKSSNAEWDRAGNAKRIEQKRISMRLWKKNRQAITWQQQNAECDCKSNRRALRTYEGLAGDPLSDPIFVNYFVVYAFRFFRVRQLGKKSSYRFANGWRTFFGRAMDGAKMSCYQSMLWEPTNDKSRKQIMFT